MAHLADTDLAGLARQRDASELVDFTALVGRHWHPVFRFLLFSLRDRDTAETLTQECFLKAYNARQSFRGDSGVRTWLMRIALNLARDHARNRRLQFWKKTQAASGEFAGLGELAMDRSASPETVLLAKERVRAVWGVAA